MPQASAIQRKGRAGRCREGICYHLFSRERYESFEKFVNCFIFNIYIMSSLIIILYVIRYQIPEIFRVPLEELCLQSKNLAPIDLSIEQFIGQVPEAPKPHVIQRAVKVNLITLLFKCLRLQEVRLIPGRCYNGWMPWIPGKMSPILVGCC